MKGNLSSFLVVPVNLLNKSSIWHFYFVAVTKYMLIYKRIMSNKLAEIDFIKLPVTCDLISSGTLKTTSSKNRHTPD